MERYGSFQVDHSLLNPGIYVSRIDKVGSGVIYTVDVRVCKPYQDKTLNECQAHSVEHIIATNFEECSTGPIKKVYFGPMGCLTGYYMLFYVPKELTNVDISRLLLLKVRDCAKWEGLPVPFNSVKECGNCFSLANDEKEEKEVMTVLNKIRTMAQKCLDNGTFDEYPML